MYGKIFETMYEGSMVGAGAHVFAVWGYCISKADPEDHIVRLNTAILSTAIGEPVDRIAEAIKYLCSRDDESTNTDHDGRRLLHLSGLSYLVVSHEHYRSMKSNEEQRAYFRDAKRKQRAKEKGVKDSQRQSQDPAYVSVSEFALEGESEGEPKPEAMGFDDFWERYPKKKAKADARKAWRDHKCAKIADEICAAVDDQKRWPEWTKDAGKFIPHPATWLRAERWEDRRIETAKKKSVI